jgi:hypothetical protein
MNRSIRDSKWPTVFLRSHPEKPKAVRDRLWLLLFLPVKPGKNCLHWLCSCQLGSYPSPFQQKDDRNATNGKASRQGLILLGIYLDDRCLAGESFGNCSHRRCEGSAVWSPGSPELGEHRPRVVVDETLEAAVGQLLRSEVERRQRGPAVAAMSFFTFHFCRNPVASSADAAGDYI